MDYQQQWDEERKLLGNPTMQELRQQLGWSRKQVADELLIPLKSYTKWETGERVPPLYVERYVITNLKSLIR